MIFPRPVASEAELSKDNRGLEKENERWRKSNDEMREREKRKVIKLMMMCEIKHQNEIKHKKEIK